MITTYSRDCRPISEHHLQISRPTAEAKASPAPVSPLQTKRETWPIFYQYFYKTTNSTYGSNTRLQEERVATETGHLHGEEEKGQLHCVCGGKANVLHQQEPKDELQQKTDVLSEKDALVFSSHVDPACCEGFPLPLCREAGLQHLLNCAMASSLITTSKVSESSSCLRCLTVANNLKSRAFLQPPAWHCSCCVWETEHLLSCCFEMRTFPPHLPRGSNLPPACIPPTIYCTEPSLKPLLTEYQSSFATQWSKPNIHK